MALASMEQIIQKPSVCGAPIILSAGGADKVLLCVLDEAFKR